MRPRLATGLPLTNVGNDRARSGACKRRAQELRPAPHYGKKRGKNCERRHAAAGAAGVTGSVMVNVVPAPGALVTATVPPSDWMYSRT